jgi:hypothetical protein
MSNPHISPPWLAVSKSHRSFITVVDNFCWLSHGLLVLRADVALWRDAPYRSTFTPLLYVPVPAVRNHRMRCCSLSHKQKDMQTKKLSVFASCIVHLQRKFANIDLLNFTVCCFFFPSVYTLLSNKRKTAIQNHLKFDNERVSNMCLPIAVSVIKGLK